jgi:hypothetical protein
VFLFSYKSLTNQFTDQYFTFVWFEVSREENYIRQAPGITGNIDVQENYQGLTCV